MLSVRTSLTFSHCELVISCFRNNDYVRDIVTFMETGQTDQCIYCWPLPRLISVPKIEYFHCFSSPI